eukprot:TRINITY_DN1004_c1_g1_i2.p1 TRINITY_DN1004_c1_g1~~TRINITY_DN1004_c1_g1_i2.p1  ORF type:complete len:119 (+),score=8.14 TRINITY_DN1004_c1_g1_i2:284-640(+)
MRSRASSNTGSQAPDPSFAARFLQQDLSWLVLIRAGRAAEVRPTQTFEMNAVGICRVVAFVALNLHLVCMAWGIVQWSGLRSADTRFIRARTQKTDDPLVLACRDPSTFDNAKALKSL